MSLIAILMSAFASQVYADGNHNTKEVSCVPIVYDLNTSVEVAVDGIGFVEFGFIENVAIEPVNYSCSGGLLDNVPIVSELTNYKSPGNLKLSCCSSLCSTDSISRLSLCSANSISQLSLCSTSFESSCSINLQVDAYHDKETPIGWC